MKTNFKTFLGGIMVAALMLMVTSTVEAQVAGPFLADATINSVSQDQNILEVRASHPDPNRFQNSRFVIVNDNKNAQLAVLLTAMSTGKTVRISFTTGNPAPNPLIITRVEIIN